MKILFVISGFNNGGSISALKNVLDTINNNLDCSIDVFAINSDGPNVKEITQRANLISRIPKGGASDKNVSESAGLARRIKRLMLNIGVDITPILFYLLAKKFEKQSYDIVVAFQEGLATQLVSSIKTKCRVAWIHCDYGVYINNLKIGPQVNRYKKFNKVISVSEYTLSQYKKYVGLENGIAIPNIIDGNIILEKSRRSVEDDLFPSGYFSIVSVGRIAPVKDFSVIPSIISKLKAKGLKRFVWYLIGGGDDQEYAKILREKQKYKADELVLLGEKNNPYPYMVRANLYVCTSISEACPYVINESKILHVPIVTTNFGSADEFVANDVNGLVVSKELLAEKIGLLMSDKPLYDKLKRNIENFKYNNELISRKLIDEVFLNYQI